MCLSDAAMKAVPAIQLRIDDDSIAGTQRTYSSVNHLARHLVSHDSRVPHRDGAIEDLVIGAADSTVCHANQELTRLRSGARHIVANQLPGCGQEHRFHRWARTSGLTGLRGDVPLSTA